MTCVYSVQKQMGRPRKRRREEPSEDADASGEADFDALADINFDSLQLQPDPLHLGKGYDSGVGLASLPGEDLLGALQQPSLPYIRYSTGPVTWKSCVMLTGFQSIAGYCPSSCTGR